MVFLELNDSAVNLSVEDFYAVSMAAASGELEREDIAAILREHAQSL